MSGLEIAGVMGLGGRAAAQPGLTSRVPFNLPTSPSSILLPSSSFPVNLFPFGFGTV